MIDGPDAQISFGYADGILNFPQLAIVSNYLVLGHARVGEIAFEAIL
jgi:hypothetical protein